MFSNDPRESDDSRNDRARRRWRVDSELKDEKPEGVPQSPNSMGDWDGPQDLLVRLSSLRPTQSLRSRKVCSARRADFGVFRHFIPAVANERSRRHASADDEKWNANDCTDYSPAK
jgi:hypothetical protein